MKRFRPTPPDVTVAWWAPKVLVLSALSGAIAGLGSFGFLSVLDGVTRTRGAHGWLVWCLPAVGFLISAVYERCDARIRNGNLTIAREIQQPSAGVPLGLAPMSLISTWATHLAGGSAGREGTAMQMSAAITDSLARRIHVAPQIRRLLIHASIAGAFGSVFGVPFAGTVFALEESKRYGLRLRALVPCAIAAFTGNAVVQSLGYRHAVRESIGGGGSLGIGVKLVVAAAVFGFVAGLYLRVVAVIRWLCVRTQKPALAAAIGGVWVVTLALLFGRQYLGLSAPLADQALRGASIAGGAFLVKLLMTAFTSGSGFRAGEVTPLFVIGAALGAALATPLGVDPKLLAALGFVAVYGAAAKVPLACTVMGIEMFGWHAAGMFVCVCMFARLTSGAKSLYPRLKHGELQ